MRVLAAISTLLVLGVPSLASARTNAVGDADVAALQVALHAASAYSGPIDGQRGPDTTHAIIAFQQRVGLVPDGIAGRRTRRALGHLGQPDLGTRPLSLGKMGWDVAELQFLLAWHGFPSGPFDGIFGSRLEAAVRRFQRFAHVPRSARPARGRWQHARGQDPTSPLRFSAPVERTAWRRVRPPPRRLPRRHRLHRSGRDTRRLARLDA